MIKKPMLPPKRGYVEVEVNGQRLYKNAATGVLERDEKTDPVDEQIALLKTELASTDYKIIKCSEAQLAGEELPYDIAVLHSERQALRDRINALERGGDA